jgi:Tfp pilus assembly protein PilO
MQQATKRFVSMIIVLLLVVGAFVIFFELIRPAYEDAQTIRSEVLSREAFVSQQQDAITQVQQLMQSYQSEQDVQNSLNQALPPAADFAGALYQINGIATGDSVGLQAMTISSPTLATTKPTANASSSIGDSLVSPLGTVTFQMKFVGRYEDIKTFVGDLEDNIRLFDVQSVNIQPAGAKPGQNLFSVDMAITTYYQLSS